MFFKNDCIFCRDSNAYFCCVIIIAGMKEKNRVSCWLFFSIGSNVTGRYWTEIDGVK